MFLTFDLRGVAVTPSTLEQVISTTKFVKSLWPNRGLWYTLHTLSTKDGYYRDSRARSAREESLSWAVSVGPRIPLVAPKLRDATWANQQSGLAYVSPQGDIKIWAYKDMHGKCLQMERVASNCEGCEFFQLRWDTATRECLSTCIGSADAEFQKQEPYGLGALDGLSLADVNELLSNPKTATHWEYVPAKKIEKRFNPFGEGQRGSRYNYYVHHQRGQEYDFRYNLPTVFEISFDRLEENKKHRSEMAVNAAQTRKAVKRCKTECIFCDSCNVQKYKSFARHCQVNSYEEATGPFTKEDMQLCVATFVQDPERFSAPSREDATFLAYNSGNKTQYAGCEFALGRITKSFDPDTGSNSHRVLWYRSTKALRNKNVIDLPMRDSRKLLSIPYRWGTQYDWPQKYERPLLSDKAYYMFCEISRVGYIPGAKSSGWGYTSLEHVRVNILQDGENPRFEVADVYGNSLRIDFDDLVKLTPRGCPPIANKILPSYRASLFPKSIS